MNVLVVDDDPDIRDTLRDALEDEGHAVSVARDGAEALTRLAALPDVALVVLDLIMPVMDGLAVYRAMRADARLASIRVIVATSDPSRAPAGVPLMKKPINLDRLIDLVAATG